MTNQTSPPPPPPAREKLTPLIRPLASTDIPALSALLSTTFTTTFAHSIPSATDLAAHLETAYSPRALAADLASPHMTSFVAVHPATGALLGVAQLNAAACTEPSVVGRPRPVELQRLYVEGAWQGAGVGGALVRFAEAWARAEGWETLWLGVWEENFSGHRAYERMGFERVGEHEFVIGTEVQRDWVMAKAL